MNWKAIIVPQEKLLNYLLSETHPIGRFKASFFRRIGYKLNSADDLKERLKMIAQEEPLIDEVQTPYGRKLIIDGLLDSPSGVKVTIRTVWMEDAKKKEIRLVTAYPVKLAGDK